MSSMKTITNLSNAKLYGAHATGATPRTKSIWNSTCRGGGSPENANPSSTLGSFPRESLDTTDAKFTARINKLLTMRQTIDFLLFKTINKMTNQSSDSEIFCPEERIKELELRMQQRNKFEEELFKNRFPTEKELAYHKELLGKPQPPFSTLEPKIRKGDP
ncbi:hypothetical protein Tco_0585233 [Tanacetum coccineum]